MVGMGNMSKHIESQKIQKLTIIIPIQNMAGKLNRLETSISQSLAQQVKFILIEDKSDDETYFELEDLKAKYSNIEIELMRVSFSSPGLARNSGLDKVQTEYFMFVDSDDNFFTSNISDAISSVPGDTDVIIGSFLKSANKFGKISVINPNHPLHLRLAMNPGLWRMVFKTSTMNMYKFKAYKMAEDQLWLAESEILNKKIVLSESIFYEYFTNNVGSLTSNKTARQDLKSVLNEFSAIKTDTSRNSKLIYCIFTKIWLRSIFDSKSFIDFVAHFVIFMKYSTKHPKIFLYSSQILCVSLQRYFGLYD